MKVPMSEDDFVQIHLAQERRRLEDTLAALPPVRNYEPFTYTPPTMKDIIMNNWDGWGKFTTALVASIVIFFMGVFWIGHYTNWVSSSAAIERLRIDAAKVSGKMAEDVAGQVSQWNQTIARHKRWRKTVVGFLIPSGWDTVVPLDMPDSQ